MEAASKYLEMNCFERLSRPIVKKNEAEEDAADMLFGEPGAAESFWRRVPDYHEMAHRRMAAAHAHARKAAGR